MQIVFILNEYLQHQLRIILKDFPYIFLERIFLIKDLAIFITILLFELCELCGEFLKHLALKFSTIFLHRANSVIVVMEILFGNI